MTDKIALWLAVVVVALFAVDVLFHGGATTVFLGKELMRLSEYIAFWR